MRKFFRVNTDALGLKLNFQNLYWPRLAIIKTKLPPPRHQTTINTIISVVIKWDWGGKRDLKFK